MKGRHDQQPRAGMTLAELLLSVAIVTILLALSLPAVQASREVARRMHCSSNLRQIGIALLEYETTFRAFPAGNANGSFLVSILPMIASDSQYDATLQVLLGHRPVAGLEPISTYFCPSDSAPHRLSTDYAPGTNYLGNFGTWIRKDGANGVFRYSRPVGKSNAAFGPVRSSEITDGLSNTVMVAEALRADGTFGRLRTVWNTPQTFKAASDFEAFVSMCNSIPTDAMSYGWQGNPAVRGRSRIEGDMTIGLYNHAMAPQTPSCFNGGAVISALSTATSQHSVVNCVFADAHVVAVSSYVDISIWRDYGSINSY